MRGPDAGHVADHGLDRQGRRLAAPAVRFVLIALALAVPGAMMVILGQTWVFAIGIGLVALATPFALVAIGLLGSSAVARWAARHRPFA